MAFQELMENVMAAGWSSVEIAEAIENLAVADRRAREETAVVDASLTIARTLGRRDERRCGRPLFRGSSIGVLTLSTDAGDLNSRSALNAEATR